MHRKPSHFGSNDQSSPAGISRASFASIGLIGRAIGCTIAPVCPPTTGALATGSRRREPRAHPAASDPRSPTDLRRSDPMSIRLARPAATAAGIAVALAATFVAGGAAAALSQSAPVAPSEPSTAAGTGTTGTITVTGEGTVTVSPDTAVLSVGVEAQAATGAAAMDLLDERSSALTDALTGAGIAADDLQTTGLNLYSTYGDDGTTVTGYVASLQVSATIRDIDAIGATIDAAQTAVGEGLTLSGVTFSFADPESVLGDARADAVADAGTKAQQLAAA